MANRTKLTPKKRALFCESLVETGGNVTRAAQSIGVARQGCYRHRDNNQAFAQAWDNAVEAGTDALEHEAYRRAMGAERDVFGRDGEKTGVIREYSNTLAIFLLKGRRPEKYRERFQMESKVDLTVYDGADKTAKAELDSILLRRETRICKKGVVKGNNGNRGGSRPV